MLPNRVIHILKVFNFFGYNSDATRVSKRRRILHIINLACISLAIFLCLFFFHLSNKYFSLLLLTEKVTEITQYMSTTFTFWLIILESFVCRRIHHEFWTLLRTIDACYKNQESLHFRWYLAKIIVYLLKTIFMLITRVLLQPYSSWEVDLVYKILFNICEIRMFNYLFCLEILHFQLKMIEEELKKASTCIDERTSNKSEIDCKSSNVPR